MAPVLFQTLMRGLLFHIIYEICSRFLADVFIRLKNNYLWSYFATNEHHESFYQIILCAYWDDDIVFSFQLVNVLNHPLTEKSSLK